MCSSPPLSLQERRQRNKAASAKYRQKKNQQHGDMRNIISHLTEDNALLSRKVDELRRENEMMRATCDQLRGRIVASKMLKRMMKTEGGDTSRTKRRRMSGHGTQDHSSHDGQSEENDDDL
jgi:predicted RNase H-like nuclease (RuvC/YqgF family)